MSEQIAVRMSDDLARALAELVEGGSFTNKAEAVRTAIEELVDRERRSGVGQQIAAGYLAVPQDDREVDEATQAAIRSIEEEPW